jgi:Lrp/AsnC family leucine-responsive transcriptional regulator
MIDQTDLKIIELLKQNSRLQWKEIGSLIHMTGQGVAARINKMEELGIIEKYTLKVNEKKLGNVLTGYIIVYMKSSDHKGFTEFIQSLESVEEAHRISGDGCYILKVNMKSNSQLNEFLDALLNYATYRLLISIDRLKG